MKVKTFVFVSITGTYFKTLVEEFGVSITPTIMVNGTMLEDPFDYEKIKSLIDQELGK